MADLTLKAASETMELSSLSCVFLRLAQTVGSTAIFPLWRTLEPWPDIEKQPGTAPGCFFQIVSPYALVNRLTYRIH